MVLRQWLACVATIAIGGCSGGGPSLEVLNAVDPIVDPTVDDTDPAAPFEPGQRRDVGDAHATFDVAGWSEHLRAVTMPGDLDGDGMGDLVMWGQLANDPDIVPCDEGCVGFSQLVVHVIYGSPSLGDDGAIAPSATIQGWHVAGLRTSVDAVGDVDGDGLADLLIGVGTELEGVQGNAFVLHGGPRLSGSHDVRDVAEALRESGTTRFDQVAGIGDVDGDALADFVVGAPEWPSLDDARGRLSLFYGGVERAPRDSDLAASASLVREGTTRLSIARAVGDVDGDGKGDFLVTEEAETVHAWWLVRGRPERMGGELDVAPLATRIDALDVSGVGDLDRDGLDDLVVVPHPDRPWQIVWGRAEWPESLDATADADTWIEGTGRDRRAFPAGDVDGDGDADLLIAEPGYAAGEEAPRGAAYLFSGPIARASGALDREESTAFLGQDWRSATEPDIRRGFDELGRSIATGDDLDGDGIDDLVFAALAAPDGGRGYLWLGRSAE